MNKRSIISLCITVALIIYIVLTIILVNNMYKKPPDGSDSHTSLTDISTNSENIQAEERTYYTIRLYGENKIGVFKNGNASPLFSLNDIVLYTLPSFDQKLLEKGITVYSDEELYSLIEDLES